MARFRSNCLWLVLTIVSLWGIAGCGSSKKSTALYPGQISLIPSSVTSLVQGGTINFTASAHTTSGTNLAVAIIYTTSDSSILNVAPNGVACAGHWDALYSTCTAGGTGLVTVTASALGASSIPTLVFVHPPIDNITVVGVLLTGLPVQEPCLSQSQFMTIEAHAYSQGSDITQAVGPFNWTAQYPTVVNIVPTINQIVINNVPYGLSTNQATATALAPGLTQIYASAGGVTSNSFLQPQFTNSQGTLSPPLNFFETCPIQAIDLQVGIAGTQETGQTSFVTTKGTSQSVSAILTDVVGNSSLPNLTNNIVLSKIPLVWTSSAPGAVQPANGCTESCSLTTPAPGAASITASCSPPSCNLGFPQAPAILSSPTCTQFYSAQFPQIKNCQQLIPYPVYSTVPISGLVTGSPLASSFFATSVGCAQVAPLTCNTSTYYPSTARNTSGNEYPLPFSPNSLLFDPTGAKAYMGSNYGAQVINPTNIGTSTSPYTQLGAVVGNVIGVSLNGDVAIFSDTMGNPNQVYVVDTTFATAPSITPLNIATAVTAAFSPDGMRDYIFGNGGNLLYIYSPLQGLQGPITLSGNAVSAAFSPNGAFGLIAESAATGGTANLSAYNTCNNQPSLMSNSLPATVTLPGNPLFMRVLPAAHIDGHDSNGLDIPDGMHIVILDSTGVDIITATTGGGACPQGLTFAPINRVELGQGTLKPLNFFVSADGSQIYVVSAGSSTILTYDFNVGSVIGGIQLQGGATPISADVTIDGTLFLVAASDGMLHEVTTAFGGSDLYQIAFPDIPNYLNPFCTFGNCTLTTVVAKP